MSDRPFAVLRLDRESRDPMALARALAAARGTPVQDQVIAARRAWGIVAEGLPEEEARALGNALHAAGVPCAVGPASALATLSDASPVTSLDALPPEAPTLIAAAAITETTITRTRGKPAPSAGKAVGKAVALATGMPVKLGRKKRPVQKTQREDNLRVLADLLYREPARRLRISAPDFDFSCLGPRMVYQGLANLRLLLGDLVQRAPDAWRNHGARVLLAGEPVRTMGYASLDDLEREERWLLTLRTIRP